MTGELFHCETSQLDIAYLDSGPKDAPPVVLLHGFPDDAPGWNAVTKVLQAEGLRTIAPYSRGFGPTRFLSDDIPKSGQLGARVTDAIELLDTLNLEKAILVGQDQGAMTAQAVAALHPERVAHLVSLLEYGVSFRAAAAAGPPSPKLMHALWYQWLFNMPMGKFVLGANHRGFCRYLWETWSPTWNFTEEEFEAAAVSFDNPDFADVIISGYRRGHGNDKGDPRFDALEKQLAAGPEITAPTTVIIGDEGGIGSPRPEGFDAKFFTGGYQRHVLEGVGHFPHRERPDFVARAILEQKSSLG